MPRMMPVAASTLRTTKLNVSALQSEAASSADLLDGQQGAYYQNASNLNAGTLDPARYSAHDFDRSARFANVAYRYPSKFPISGVTASRAVLWLEQHQPDAVVPFVHAVFRALFRDDRDVSDPAVVTEVAGALGIDTDRLMAGVQEQAIKDALKTRVDEAIAFGLFGAPTIVVDGEVFWGNDRLPQIVRWLAAGPF